jgi:uncharacterized Zn finger protein
LATTSKCPRCENTSFEAKIEAPVGAGRQLQFVRCANCGTVVGVTEWESTNDLLRQIINKLDRSNT